MEEQVSAIIHYIARSQHELSRTMEANRNITVHAAKLIHAIPAPYAPSGGIEEVKEHALLLTKSVTAYLNSLALMEEAVADNLEIIMKELKDPKDE